MNIKIVNMINIFEKTNEIFLKEQKEFILSGVSERAWYNPFSRYLEIQLIENNIEGYYVDTEYNRNGGNLKTIQDDRNNLEIIKVTCDVIAHSRGKNIKQDNLICMEMKKSTATKKSKEDDKNRVRILTKDSFDDVWSYDGKELPEHVCRYKLGVYYEINIRRQIVHVEYYQKGKKVREYDINF